MESFLRKFQNWMATTITGSAFKVGLGAVLAYLLEQQTNLNPVVSLLVVVLVPIVINFLNSADSRYGLGTGDEG